jgi:hypothetical protein
VLGIVLHGLSALPVPYLIATSVPSYLVLLIAFKAFSRSDVEALPGAERWLAKRWISACFPTKSAPSA